MVIYLNVNLKMIKKMVEEPINGMMALNLMVNIKMIKTWFWNFYI